jgi:hypothetical protein
MQKYIDKVKWAPDTCEQSEEPVHVGPAISLHTGKAHGSNYVFWELTYYEHLLEMRDMYADVILRTNPDMKIQIYSPSFFKDFSRMIWENSSGEISPYVEDLTDAGENSYMNYRIKSNF